MKTWSGAWFMVHGSLSGAPGVCIDRILKFEHLGGSIPWGVNCNGWINTLGVKLLTGWINTLETKLTIGKINTLGAILPTGRRVNC